MVNEFINKIKKVNKKIIVAGAGGVGKTTLLYRFTKNYFNPAPLTKGIQFFTQSINIGNKDTNFIFWDLAGESRWRFFQGDFCRGADGVILAFDLTRNVSFKDCGIWVNFLRNRNRDLPIILLGLKYELKDRRGVPDDKIVSFLEEFKFFDTVNVSSKTGENVQKAFQSLFSHILKIPSEKRPVIKYRNERTKKIERMLQVSNRIRLEMMRNALNMEKKAFDEKIFEWAEEFGFIIDEDILIVDKDTVSDYINKLDIMFETWEKSETEKLS